MAAYRRDVLGVPITEESLVEHFGPEVEDQLEPRTELGVDVHRADVDRFRAGLDLVDPNERETTYAGRDL